MGKGWLILVEFHQSSKLPPLYYEHVTRSMTTTNRFLEALLASVTVQAITRHFDLKCYVRPPNTYSDLRIKNNFELTNKLKKFHLFKIEKGQVIIKCTKKPRNKNPCEEIGGYSLINLTFLKFLSKNLRYNFQFPLLSLFTPIKKKKFYIDDIPTLLLY